ncbi:MAG: IS66 family insertion sequence element accessory protein TnpB [Clostridium sp.]|nr:IS66 family insertion sequence element accessory protein TnpB [Clostridium sp.]
MDQVTLVKNQYRLEQWTKLIQECRSSGMKVDDWCEANGVTHHAYYYWLRKIRQAACLYIPTVNAAQNPSSFKRLEVQTPAARTQAAVIIHLPADTLEVHNGASQQTVETVLLALKSLC